MRVAITSDLHLPITPLSRIAALGREMAGVAPDVVVLAGDVAESLADLRRCLGALREPLKCPIWVLPGNHDLWSRDAASRLLWEELLPETVRQAGCHWLEGQAFVHEELAIAGSVAWYDYSAADPTIQASPVIFAREKRHFNMDAVMIDWPWSDVEFATRAATPFLATLDRLENDAAVRRVIVATHVPLLECQMLRKPHDRDWGFSNAYFGNLTLGRQVLSRRKVTHVISGHTHIERAGIVRCEDGREIMAHVLGSEYGRPKWLQVEWSGAGKNSM